MAKDFDGKIDANELDDLKLEILNQNNLVNDLFHPLGITKAGDTTLRGFESTVFEGFKIIIKNSSVSEDNGNIFKLLEMIRVMVKPHSL